MNLQELRIGNWINRGGEVYPSTEYTLLISRENDAILEPVPLTEEWYNKLNRPDDLGMVWIYSGNSLKIFHMGVTIAVLHNVHSYQNLYFALTGKELMVKEEKK